IHELPSPAPDLLEQADQLANLLRKQLRADGSLNVDEPGQAGASANAESVKHGPGRALYGIIRSHALRPEAWKLEALRKGRAYYHDWWQRNKNMEMLPWHTAAYIEAHLATKEPGFATAVFEMNDWLCGLQYQQVDPRRARWAGGFQTWT